VGIPLFVYVFFGFLVCLQKCPNEFGGGWYYKTVVYIVREILWGLVNLDFVELLIDNNPVEYNR